MLSTMSEPNTVLCGSQVILQKENVLKCFEVRNNRTVNMEKTKLHLEKLIGLTWGTTFDVIHGNVEIVGPDEMDEEEVELDESKDNRSLVDTSANQKLTREEIIIMKKDGATGQDILENLIENSASFHKKTEFAQQKYIRKKRKKHEARFTILKPNTRLISKMYFNRGPSKILNLRIDAISQILSYGNVHSGCRVMLLENCIGLLLGAILERMGGSGKIVQFYSGSAPIRQAIETFGFPKEYNDILFAYPLDQVALLKTKETIPETATENSVTEENLENDEHKNLEIKTESNTHTESQCGNNERPAKRKWEDLTEEEREQRKHAKQEALRKVRNIIKSCEMDALILASKHHPRPIVLELIEYLLPSRPLVIFSQHKEPLIDCYIALKDRGDVVSLRLSETWLREYQVLPNRSHPEINMSCNGGYLLTGIKVES